MSTKYVLQSGGIKHHSDKKRTFHREIVKDLGNEPVILLCNFPQPREVWEEKYDGYQQTVIEDMPENIVPSFKLAMTDTFVEDCKKADVIYIHGGDDHLAKYWLSKYDLKNIWANKVIATNSGSSQAISSYYWTCDWRNCDQGLGLVPIKFMAHYKSPNYGLNDPRGPINWGKALEDLKAYGDTTLPIHALEEGDYVVIEQ